MANGSIICKDGDWIAGLDGRVVANGPDTHFSCSGPILEQCCMPAPIKDEDDYWDSFVNLEEVEE